MNKRFQKIIFIVFALIGFNCLSLNMAAQAYYWGYSPFTGGSWLWLTQSLFYPFGRTNRFGYNSFYNGAPYYLANSLVWNASYMANQALVNRNISRQQAELERYQDPEPIYSPRNRVRPVYPGQFAYDQVVSASFPPAKPVIWPQNAPNYAPNLAVPPAIPVVNPINPNTAPDLASVAPPPQIAPVPVLANNSSAINAPFAQGFIDLVNNKYESNIGKALLDGQTKSYAQAIGLIENKNIAVNKISVERIELIGKILQDTNEDPLTKINTIRLLLKH